MVCCGAHFVVMGYVTHPNHAAESSTHFPCFDDSVSPSCCAGVAAPQLRYGDLPLRRDDPRWTAEPRCFDLMMNSVECCSVGMARWRVGDRAVTGESQESWELKHLYSSAVDVMDFWGTVLHIISDKRDPMGWQQHSYVHDEHSRYRELIVENTHALRDDMFFVDVGCSVGTVSILLLLRFPRSRGICVEMSPLRVNYIAWNLRVNGIAAERPRLISMLSKLVQIDFNELTHVLQFVETMNYCFIVNLFFILFVMMYIM